MTTVLMLLLGVVLTAGTFVFVSAEFSLVKDGLVHSDK